MMSAHTQDEIFSAEGDQWFERNKTFLVPKEGRSDVTTTFLRGASFRPKAILDIGCANGYFLDHVVSLFPGAEGYGIEPSARAVEDGQTHFPRLHLSRGASHELGAYRDGQFDCIILQFVLHWVDRRHLLKTIAEVDRVLADGGHVLIADFFPAEPCKTRYHHLPNEEVYTYKQPYWELFTATKCYSLLDLREFTHDGSADKNPMNRCALAVLEKRTLEAYPLADIGGTH